MHDVVDEDSKERAKARVKARVHKPRAEQRECTLQSCIEYVDRTCTDEMARGCSYFKVVNTARSNRKRD